ncbi:sulfotransferase [Maricaulis sp.]|uniref:sulfotransferase n=2 Tax=Maricaulis sp. TaxID=1486257 RepID=UPI00329746D5
MMQDTRLAQAGQLRLANDFAGARALCEAVLADRPGDAEALALLGVCAVETGDLAGGRAWLDQAEASDPGLGLVPLYRSILHEAEADLPAALSAAQKASELSPDRFDVWGRFGDLAGRVEDFETAARALKAALATADTGHPARPHVALRLAGAELELRRLDAAAAALDVAEASGLAGTVEVLRLRAELARLAGDFDALTRFAEAWHALNPDDMDARGALAMGWGQQGYYRRAIHVYRPVVDADPAVADNWAALGRLTLGARDIDGARAAFETALSLNPDCVEACLGLARIHTFRGEQDAAVEMCRRALAVDPANFEAYGQLSEVSGGRLSDEETARLEDEAGKSGIPADQLSIGLFALGDVRHRRGQFDAAFEAWSRANDTKKLQHNGAIVSAYDRSEQTRRTDWLTETFTAPVAKPALSATPSPIFIVGMPRSGTTLIEAAIAAHDDVTAGGELSVMPVLFEAFVRWARDSGWTGGVIPGPVLAPWRERYLAQYSEFGLSGARWVTDKQPSNFLSVGLIQQMFPDAPIIHIRRKPVEVAFSIYRRNFSRMWPFAHDLGDIAHYYAEQARLGAHWASVFPDTVIPLQYEDLVSDFEAQLRRVLARCGLDWSKKCLEYYKLERTVMTFSAVQVRRPPSPVYLDSTSPYAEQLKPFAKALEELAVDPQTGEWLADGRPGGTDDASPSARTGFLRRFWNAKPERQEP